MSNLLRICLGDCGRLRCGQAWCDQLRATVSVTVCHFPGGRPVSLHSRNRYCAQKYSDRSPRRLMWHRLMRDIASLIQFHTLRRKTPRPTTILCGRRILLVLTLVSSSRFPWSKLCRQSLKMRCSVSSYRKDPGIAEGWLMICPSLNREFFIKFLLS